MNRSEIRIASPCQADWSSMSRDGRRRFCDACRKHVHDLSSMSQHEAQAVLASAETETLCVRYIHDSEGNIRFADTERKAWKREIAEEFIVPSNSLVRAKRAAIAMLAASIPMSLLACSSGATQESSARTAKSPSISLSPIVEIEPARFPQSAVKAGATTPAAVGRTAAHPVLQNGLPTNVNPVEGTEPEIEMKGEAPARPMPPPPSPAPNGVSGAPPG